MMNEPVILSDAEKAILVELLTHEEESLSPEIRHTRTASVKDELRERREVMRGLLQRLRESVPS